MKQIITEFREEPHNWPLLPSGPKRDHIRQGVYQGNLSSREYLVRDSCMWLKILPLHAWKLFSLGQQIIVDQVGNNKNFSTCWNKPVKVGGGGPLVSLTWKIKLVSIDKPFCQGTEVSLLVSYYANDLAPGGERGTFCRKVEYNFSVRKQWWNLLPLSITTFINLFYK